MCLSSSRHLYDNVPVNTTHTSLEELLTLEGYTLHLSRIEPDNQPVKTKEAPRESFDSKLQEALHAKGIQTAHAGMPDLIIQTHDGPIFVEVKSPKDRLSPSQVRTLQLMANLGFKVYVAKYATSSKPSRLIRNPSREASMTRISWTRLLEFYEQPIPPGADHHNIGNDDQWPIIGPMGKAGVYHRKNAIIDYGHNAIRRAKVALLGDQRKY